MVIKITLPSIKKHVIQIIQRTHDAATRRNLSKIGNRPITGEKADADKKLAVFCHAYRQNQLWG